MGRKKIPGLVNRKGTWHIDKVIRGKRVCESTGTGDIDEAESYLAHRIEEIRQAEIYGVRPVRNFRQAATKLLNETTVTRPNELAAWLKMLDPFIGDLPLESVHMGTLQPFIDYRKQQKVKNRTINHGLESVRRILQLAASEWLDEKGRPWLGHAPRIKLLPRTDQKAPYLLSWDEQTRLFSELPEHLAQMALFKVNTGCRQTEVCQLR